MKPEQKVEQVTISKPNIVTMPITITGTAPLVQNRFGAKAMVQMTEKQAAGSQAQKGKKRDPKDFDLLFAEAQHISTEGWAGLPANGIRAALISACRLVGFKMTIGKMSVFVEAEGYDRVDRTPLVRITKGEPIRHTMPVRNATGVVDIRVRPLWEPGWQATFNIRFDRDQFSPADVVNLLHRAGEQVGLGEGRPDSKMSCGMGWGTFRVQAGEQSSTVEAA